MPSNTKQVEEIEAQIKKDFSLSFDELKKLYFSMLDNITSTANRSPAYTSVKHITDISPIRKLERIAVVHRGGPVGVFESRLRGIW